MSANPINNELAFGDAALRHWALLGEELRQDIQQFNERGGSVEFAQQASTEYRVTNPASGLEVHIVADTDDHMVRYEFVRANDNSAGAPEGGILSMRMAGGDVEFYSADRQLTASEARSLLLDPVLNLASS